MKGGHIDQVIAALGQPVERTTNAVRWERSEQHSGGGYWTTVTETVNHYDKKGKYIGYSEVPMQQYVEPWARTDWCRTTVYMDEMGNVLDYNLEGNDCFYNDFWDF